MSIPPPFVKASFKLSIFALACLVLIVPQMLIMAASKGKAAYILPRLWHKLICRTFGLRVRVLGKPYRAGQAVFVANHLSYLDIPVMGSVLNASFVAKKEVADWPVFGTLAKLQQTAFIDRSRNTAMSGRFAVGGMLSARKNLVIFPEGTSTDGREVLPFKSSLFSLMLEGEYPGLMIQPFTVSMTLVDGQEPKSQDIRDLYSWHRDMDTELPVHLWRFAKTKGAIITLHFHEAFQAPPTTDRKELAKICHEQVASGLGRTA